MSVLDNFTEISPFQNAHQESASTTNIYHFSLEILESGIAENQKALVRDVQVELTSAWMYYMNMNLQKTVLVLVSQLTSLPISLGRMSQRVIVHGLDEKQTQFLKNIAAVKEVTNVEISVLEKLPENRYDLVVFIGHPEIKTNELNRFCKNDGAIWVVASNFQSLANLKSRFKGLFRPTAIRCKQEYFSINPAGTSKNIHAVLSGFGMNIIAEIGLAPNLFQLRTAKPYRKIPKWGADSLGRYQKLLTEHIIVGATKADTEQTYWHHLLRHVKKHDLLKGELVNYQISPSGKVMLFTRFFFQDRFGEFLIRLPFNPQAEERVRKSHQVLFYLQNKYQDDQNTKNAWFPVPVAQSSFQNQPYFIESLVPGESGDKLKNLHRNPEYLLKQVFRFWGDVQQKLATNESIDKDNFYLFFEEPIRKAFYFMPEKQVDYNLCEKVISYLKSRLFQKDFKLSLIHGDFSLKNIMFNQQSKKITGIIDWDMVVPKTFPILDLLHYFLRTKKESYTQSATVLLYDILMKPRTEPGFHKMLLQYEKLFSTSADLYPVLCILYWAYRLSGHIGTSKYLDKKFVQHNYAQPLQKMGEIVK